MATLGPKSNNEDTLTPAEAKALAAMRAAMTPEELVEWDSMPPAEVKAWAALEAKRLKDTAKLQAKINASTADTIAKLQKLVTTNSPKTANLQENQARARVTAEAKAAAEAKAKAAAEAKAREKEKQKPSPSTENHTNQKPNPKDNYQSNWLMWAGIAAGVVIALGSGVNLLLGIVIVATGGILGKCFEYLGRQSLNSLVNNKIEAISHPLTFDAVINDETKKLPQHLLSYGNYKNYHRCKAHSDELSGMNDDKEITEKLKLGR